MEIITNSDEETIKFAEKFAKNLKAGEILGLIGELGAGKTIFTRGLAKGLGIKQNITSPTFNLMRVYEIRDSNPGSGIKRFCHIDAYRVSTEFDIINIGAEDFIGQDDIVAVIEWAERIRDILPRRTKYITIENIDKNKRKITIEDKK